MTIDGGGDWNLDMDGGFGDLDLNFGEPSNDLDEDSMAVEVARDAAPARSARESMASALNLNKPDFDNMSVHTGDGGDFEGMDIDVGDVAAGLNLDFGDMFGDVNEPSEPARPEDGSRACECPLWCIILVLMLSQLLQSANLVPPRLSMSQLKKLRRRRKRSARSRKENRSSMLLQS